MTTLVSSVTTAAASAAATAIEKNVGASFATFVTTITALGASLTGATAQNFDTFVVNFASDVEANPTQAGVYSSSFKTRWAQFVAAETAVVDTDLAEAIGVVANLFDNVLSSVASAASTLETIV